MAKTTAYYRRKALDFESKGNLSSALKNYNLAIKNYPKSQTIGELGKRDLATLKARRRDLL